jgi:hypothetical protein
LQVFVSLNWRHASLPGEQVRRVGSAHRIPAVEWWGEPQP